MLAYSNICLFQIPAYTGDIFAISMMMVWHCDNTDILSSDRSSSHYASFYIWSLMAMTTWRQSAEAQWQGQCKKAMVDEVFSSTFGLDAVWEGDGLFNTQILVLKSCPQNVLVCIGSVLTISRLTTQLWSWMATNKSGKTPIDAKLSSFTQCRQNIYPSNDNDENDGVEYSSNDTDVLNNHHWTGMTDFNAVHK